MKTPTALVIFDGFGYRSVKQDNAISQASMPMLKKLLAQYSWTTLKASGTAVGLLNTMIGNSQVGHITIGSGRIIRQPVAQLHTLIDSGIIYTYDILIQKLKELKNSGRTLHIMGLLSDAGVHSHEYHLWGLLRVAAAQGLTQVIIHPFLDGRDVPPQSASLYLSRLDTMMEKIGIGTIGSLHGRYYAMDRDNHWDLTRISYEVLTMAPTDESPSSWQEALKYSYAQNLTDEFLSPIALKTHIPIDKDDGLIFFNFRPDRARQLTRVFIDSAFNSFTRPLPFLSWMITAISYSPDFTTYTLCTQTVINHTLLDVLQEHSKRIFSIAETEKYAHITYFFNGGKETVRPHETRILIPSVTHTYSYASQPRMSADSITAMVTQSLTTDPHDFYLINYANADMVGHSGDFQATCKALQALDEQLAVLYTKIVVEMGGVLYITSDHGNAEDMWDSSVNQPRTAHTNNPVYFLRVSNNKPNIPLRLTQLSDIAPFILEQLDLPVPTVMLHR